MSGMQAAALQLGHEASVTGLNKVKDIKRPNSQQRNHTAQVSIVLLMCLCCGVLKTYLPPCVNCPRLELCFTKI